MRSGVGVGVMSDMGEDHDGNLLIFDVKMGTRPGMGYKDEM